jgi:hypothetical protein
MMAKAVKISGTEQVGAFMATMDPAWRDTVNILRSVILEADPEIAEQVKWNAPAFYYNGEMKAFAANTYKRDIVVLNLRQKDHVLLVFPTGAAINSHGHLLEGDDADGRRMIKISSAADARAKKRGLQEVLRAWLDTVER